MDDSVRLPSKLMSCSFLDAVDERAGDAAPRLCHEGAGASAFVVITLAALPADLILRIAAFCQSDALSALSRTCHVCNAGEFKPKLRNRGRGVTSGLTKRLLRELRDVRAGSFALAGCVHRMGPVVPLGCKEDDACVDLFHWHATIYGPPGTPYEGGRFLVEFNFTPDYPFKPPRMKFITRVLHMNITHYGTFCRGLSFFPQPAMTAYHYCMMVAFDVLANPDPGAMEISRDLEDQVEYNAKAREWTQRHARLHVRLRLWALVIAKLLGSLRRVRLAPGEHGDA